MASLPVSAASLLVRTSFSDADAWQFLLRAVAEETTDGFRAYVEVVDDGVWNEVPPHEVRAALPDSSDAAVVFIADRQTLATSEHPVLVIDLWGGHAPFRCIASELWGPDNNLNIGNMDFHEFSDAVDADGIFRGFARRD